MSKIATVYGGYLKEMFYSKEPHMLGWYTFGSRPARVRAFSNRAKRVGMIAFDEAGNAVLTSKGLDFMNLWREWDNGATKNI